VNDLRALYEEYEWNGYIFSLQLSESQIVDRKSDSANGEIDADVSGVGEMLDAYGFLVSDVALSGTLAYKQYDEGWRVETNTILVSTSLPDSIRQEWRQMAYSPLEAGEGVYSFVFPDNDPGGKFAEAEGYDVYVQYSNGSPLDGRQSWYKYEGVAQASAEQGYQYVFTSNNNLGTLTYYREYAADGSSYEWRCTVPLNLSKEGNRRQVFG
jgi:hypothetical protein